MTSKGFDITTMREQDQRAEELRRSEFYFAESQRLAHAGSWSFTPDGAREYWSAEWFDILGLDPAQGAGPTWKRSHDRSRQQVGCSVDVGNPAEVINENASADQNTLIVMATHGGSGIRRWLLGSVAHQLLQQSTNDMFLIRVTDEGRTGGEAMPKTAILPLDGSPFAEQVAPRIEELAERIGLKLVLLRVGAGQPAAMDHPVSLSMDECFHQLGSELHQYLGAKIRELRGKGLVDVVAAVKFGYAADQIIGAARETRNSFVALCTHRGSGLNRWALASVTNAVVRQSQGPVLVIRGDAMQSSDERWQETVRNCEIQ